MKPYLEPSTSVAFLVEWGGFIVLVGVVLAPFVIISLKRFRPTTWKHILGAYVSSFALFFLTSLLVNVVHDWIQQSYINYGWLTAAISEAEVKEWVLLLALWPLSVFLSTKLLYGSINKKRFYFSLLITLGFLIVLSLILIYVIALGLGFIGQYL